MRTQNSKKKSTTSDKVDPQAVFMAIDAGYRKAKRLFYIAIALGVVGIALAINNRYNVVDVLTPATESCGIAAAAPSSMPKADFPLLHQEWKDYLAMPEMPRRACLRDPSYRNLLCARAWKSPNPDNQFIGKEYEAWITEDIPPRVLNVPRLTNVRDMGGWKTEDGTKRIRQGLIIRSSALNAKSFRGVPGHNYIDVRSQQVLVKELGVKTDVDLRWDVEVEGMERSPLGPDVAWKHHAWSWYKQIGDVSEQVAFAEIFRDLIDTNNLPALVHCVYGRDRTGTLCFILEGILGVSDDDKFKDWEASAFWFNDTKFNHQMCIDDLTNWLKATYTSRSLNEDCVAYAKACGLTDEELQAFRQTMLEDIGQ